MAATIAPSSNAGNNAFKVRSKVWPVRVAKNYTGQGEAHGCTECQHYGSSRFVSTQTAGKCFVNNFQLSQTLYGPYASAPKASYRHQLTFLIVAWSKRHGQDGMSAVYFWKLWPDSQADTNWKRRNHNRKLQERSGESAGETFLN